MILIISPAKTLDLSEETRYTANYSLPSYQQEAHELVRVLSGYSATQIKELMGVSDNLAQLNYERYQKFQPEFNPENAKQALLTFNGDVYTGFDLETYGEADYRYAQEHLRILSGLYGLLRPLDLIQPYRLEMGTRLKNEKGKDLYAFWGDQIARALNQALEEAGTSTLVNLASNEYFKSVDTNALAGDIITPSFKDIRGGKPKVISFFAKKARGLMCDFAIKEKVSDPEKLKAFNGMGYEYNPELSSEKDWVFTREDNS